jgi:hypothetical protein
MGNPAISDSSSHTLSRLFCLLGLLGALTSANAGTLQGTGGSLGFFTNVASRLLSSQLNLDATHIQIYPTNQYTPSVHRLFQVAANVYESTSTNRFPSVFRPLFSRDADGFGTNLFITGFTKVDSVTGPTDSQLALPVEVALLAETNILVLDLPVNVYGVPWIIGARKGLPNFNKFDLESAFQLARKLQVTRESTNDVFPFNPSHYSFNQMCYLSLSNQFGLEYWNSYSNPYTGSVAIYVRDTLAHAVLTNDEGFTADFPVFPVAGSIEIPNGNIDIWPGYNPATDPFGSLQSFQIPLNTNVTVITGSMYRFNVGGNVEEPGHIGPYLTTNLTLPYEANVTFNGQPNPQPHWRLITSNEIQVFMLDTSVVPNRVIDYVQLAGPDNVRDLTSEIIANYDAPVVSTVPSGSQLWNTNFLNGNGFSIPIGLLSQIGVSIGSYAIAPASGTWGQTSPTLIANEIAGFAAFFGFTPPPPFGPGEVQAIAAAQVTNAMQAPFTPMATVVEHISWQANDPLVHYLASDLNWLGAVVSDRNVDSLTNNNPNGTLGALNQHYMPWGGNPLFIGFDKNPYDLALKDPLVRASDDWNFPTNQFLSGEWLGRVHRGTPWQTIYLKSPNVLQELQIAGGVTNYTGTNAWMTWTGDANTTDAVAMAPVQDGHEASLLAYIMNTKPFQSLFPVNSPKPNAWFRVLNGLTALTNITLDNPITFGGATAQFDTLVIRPHSPQTELIANAIESARAGQPGGVFHDVGDILVVPQLSDESPFLNWNDTAQQEHGITDEAYEIIPSQLLPLLRADSLGSFGFKHGHAVVQFTGYDDHAYAVEISPDLVNWTRIGTNCPSDGVFTITNSAAEGNWFFRSVLLR